MQVERALELAIPDERIRAATAAVKVALHAMCSCMDSNGIQYFDFAKSATDQLGSIAEKLAIVFSEEWMRANGVDDVTSEEFIDLAYEVLDQPYEGLPEFCEDRFSELLVSSMVTHTLIARDMLEAKASAN